MIRHYSSVTILFPQSPMRVSDGRKIPQKINEIREMEKLGTRSQIKIFITCMMQWWNYYIECHVHLTLSLLLPRVVKLIHIWTVIGKFLLILLSHWFISSTLSSIPYPNNQDWCSAVHKLTIYSQLFNLQSKYQFVSKTWI